MGGFAVWTIFWKHKYISLLSSHNYAFAAYGLFLAGGLAIIGGIFGWCAVWRENRAILLCVSTLESIETVEMIETGAVYKGVNSAYKYYVPVAIVEKKGAEKII